MDEDRFCSNCRVELPDGVEVCPACGVFAGELFDGRTDVQKRSWRKLMWSISTVVVIMAMLAGAWYAFHDSPYVKRMMSKPTPAPVAPAPTRVVSDRPGGERRVRGAALTQSEAVRVLRRQLTSTGEKTLKNECLAILSNGTHDGFYLFSVVDSCEHIRLGKWRVNGKTEEVSLAK